MENIVEIFDMSYEGSGVGKLDGKIVFVPKTLVGDVVRIKKIKDTSAYIVGQVDSFVRQSDDRVGPKCPYFERCGGCNFQNCGYNKELEIKKMIVSKEFAKIGYCGEIDIVSSEERYNYRNKIKLEYIKGMLGYFETKSNRLVGVSECEIADQKINFALEKVKCFLNKNSFSFLKSVYIKTVGEDVGICFLFRKDAQKSLKNAKNIEILSQFNVFCADGAVLESNETQVYSVFGKNKFIYKWQDFECEVDISAFNQVNDLVAKKMYQFVLSNSEGKRVVNAYSGQGLLTFLLAQKAKFVYGIEYQETAHMSAEKLKEKLDVYKIENVCGRVEDCLGQILMKDCIDLIVLDPAREGCAKKVVEEIMYSGVDEVMYISCNFATQVRDLKLLKENYEIKNVTIFDMFPCTANMETVVRLKKK